MRKKWYRVQAIGYVQRSPQPGDSDFVDPTETCHLVIDQRWEPGLTGIEEYSHLVVVFWLDRATRRRVAGPLGSAEGNTLLPPVGFFALRTPRRPNPIGIACPRLLGRNGNILEVSGIDAWHNTPIIDIKGYSPRDELRQDAIVPIWLTELWRSHDVR